MKNQFSPLSLAVALTAVLALAGWFVRDRSDSMSRLPEGDQATAVRVEVDSAGTRLAIQSPTLRAQSDLPPAEIPSLAWSPDQVEGGSEAIPRQVLAARWASVSFEQMLERLQTATEGPMWAAHDLEHWLMAHPMDGAEIVLQSLREVTTNEWTLSGLLVHGLAQTEIDSARPALLSILSDVQAYPPMVAIQAAMAAGVLGATASPDLRATLMQLIDSPLTDDQDQLADAALSSLARLAKDDLVSQRLMVQRLAPWLEANAAPDQTVKAMSALASAAVDDPDLKARAVHWAQSDNQRIRAAAEEYLSSIGQPAAVAMEERPSGS